MPRNTTESENKVVKIIEKVIAGEIAACANIKNLCSDVKLTPYAFGDKLPKMMVISIHADLIRFVRAHYKEYLSACKKEFPGNMIVTIRNTEVPAKKGLTVNRRREEILSDLCFPGVIMGRSAEVETRDDVTQFVYLDVKNSYWSEPEMKTIEKAAAEILKDKYVLDMFVH